MHCTTSSGSRIFLLQRILCNFFCPRFFDYEFAILSVFVSHFFRLCILSFIKKNKIMASRMSLAEISRASLRSR